MVAQDQVTAWDLKPNRENTNQIFNVLCNVQPVEHPWSGEWHLRQTDVTEWSKQQYWFEKCKGLKRCKLFKYIFKDWEADIEEITKWSELVRYTDWYNANFTDVITFQWYRIYMRKNNTYLNPYGNEERDINVDNRNVRMVNGTGDWDPDTCDEMTSPDDEIRRTSQDVKYNYDFREPTAMSREALNDLNYIAATRTRIYVQLIDTKECTWDTFDSADESPIILMKEYESSECNPDHFVMWYGWIGTPYAIWGKKNQEQEREEIKIAMIYFWWQTFAYLYNQDVKIPITYYVNLLWIYVSWLSEPDIDGIDMLSQLWLPLDWYFIPNVSELLTVLWIEELQEWEDTSIKEVNVWTILWGYQDYWEIPYMAVWNRLIAINWFYSLKEANILSYVSDEELAELIYQWDVTDRTACEASSVDAYTKRRIFMFDSIVENATNKYTITWLETWNTRLCYIAWNDLYVSWAWIMNWIFWFDTEDRTRWVHTLPAWLTDVKTMYWSLLFFWPRSIYAIQNEQALIAGNFINATENQDWYYSPWSFYNDDGEFLIVRRWKLLETLQFSAYYWTVQFTPDTWFYVNWHIKALDNKHDLINIDATINHRYISIFDNNPVWPHYSKLLIYNKHYNCWYHWLITNARVIHVKDNIFLWDWVYVNKWRTWWWESDDKTWWEIIEIISAYVWEEWLQTPKQIQFVKTAIWDHSVITSNSKWDINTSFGWRLFERRNDITVTRHPQLLFSKNSTKVIKDYENGEQIYWHWEQLQHTLLNEISEYRHYDKFSETIIREMWGDLDSKSKLAMFASIKEPVNAPANVLELCISARKLDNIQFGSFYIGYYTLDADYEDIENTNIDISDLSDQTSEIGMVMNKWEYCEEILEGSACDSPQDDLDCEC